MSILTGKQILREVERGRIHINPFHEKRVNPNSYNLRLDSDLLVYEKNYCIHEYLTEVLKHTGLVPVTLPEWMRVEPLDMRVEEKTVPLKIPPEGLALFPQVLYLACTIETAGADVFVPAIEGRSSVGRFGMQVHITAGFGDLSFSGPGCPAQWTCEITVVHSAVVYSNVEICQIAFTMPYQDEDLGELPRYKGKYTGQRGPKPSGLWRDFR
jgi:dCTP deaminase